MIQVRQFIKEDFYNLELRDIDKQFVNPETIERYLDTYELWGVFTYFNELNQIICIAGVIPYWEGTAELVLIPSVHIDNYKFTLFPSLRNSLNFIINDNKFQRVHATIRQDFKEAIRTAKFFGMCEEGLMQYYAKGYNYYIYAKCQQFH